MTLMKRPRRGFTLVEILVVVALIGVIAVAGFAPVVFTVERLRGLRSDYANDTALRMAAQAVCRDFRQGQVLEGQPQVRLVRHDVLGGEADDRLIFWSGARQRFGESAGSFIYMLVTDPGDEFPFAGLYRWFLPAVAPGDVNPEGMGPDGAELVIPEVRSLRAAFFRSGEWVDEYEGPYPQGLRITLAREDGSYTYADWLPNGWN